MNVNTGKAVPKKTAREIVINMDVDKTFADLHKIYKYHDEVERQALNEKYANLFAETKGDREARRKLKKERSKDFLKLNNELNRIGRAKRGVATGAGSMPFKYSESDMQDILNLIDENSFILEEHKAREPKVGGGNVGRQMRKVFANGGVEDMSPEEIKETNRKAQQAQTYMYSLRTYFGDDPVKIKEAYDNPELLAKASPSPASLVQFTVSPEFAYKNDKEFFNSVHANLIKLQEESERQPKQEGGDVDMQMSELMPLETKQQDMVPQMETEQQDMVPDMEMEEDYLDFILDEALTDEEEVMLETKLEQDEELAMLFDKVVDVAQEFAGAGLVEGPGNGVSDSIPARLSDGEFVFTAKAAKEIGTDTLMSVMKEAEAKADARQGMANGGMLPEEVKPSPVFGTKPDESTIPNEIKEGMVATNPLDPRHRYFQ